MKKYSRRWFMTQAPLLALSGWSLSCGTDPKQQARPNILWIIAEDMCPDLGCYGNRIVQTPNIDRLAGEGVRYTHAFTSAPVCSASRSAFMTGMYQTSIDAQHHKSHRDDGYVLPEPVRVLPEYFREAGYFTANIRNGDGGIGGSGKDDFNFNVDKPWDGTDWNQRQLGQPFYAQISFNESKPGDWHLSRNQLNAINPDHITPPPYHPNHPVVRQSWADYYGAVHRLDQCVGAVLDRLEREGLADSTVVFFFADHGRAMVRCKQWLYDGGIHIPLIIRYPDGRNAGIVCDDLVNAIDFGPASLSLAGIMPPDHMHGRDFLETDVTPREYIIAARDRCDETSDRIRCVRTQRYKYIRNFFPERPYTQLNYYVEQQFAAMAVLRELQAAKALTPAQARFMAPVRPAEELYDLSQDPYEIENLAADQTHRKVLLELREVLDNWIAITGDKGAFPEKNIRMPKNYYKDIEERVRRSRG